MLFAWAKEAETEADLLRFQLGLMSEAELSRREHERHQVDFGEQPNLPFDAEGNVVKLNKEGAGR